MAEFEKAIALDPNSFEGHYFYARACFAQGKLERAAALFERAAEIKPDDYQSVCLLASRSIVPSAATAKRRVPRERGIERAERRADTFTRITRGRPTSAPQPWSRLGQNDRAKEWC